MESTASPLGCVAGAVENGNRTGQVKEALT